MDPGVNMWAVVRMGVRLCQIASSVIALGLVAAGFKNKQFIGLGDRELDLMVSNRATVYAMLMSYTALLYSLHALVAVEIFKISRRSAWEVELGKDLLLAVLLMIAGIVLATADVVHHCDDYIGIADLLRCNNLKSGMAFVFVTMAAFLVSAGVGVMTRADVVRTTYDNTKDDHVVSDDLGEVPPTVYTSAETPVCMPPTVYTSEGVPVPMASPPPATTPDQATTQNAPLSPLADGRV